MTASVMQPTRKLVVLSDQISLQPSFWTTLQYYLPGDWLTISDAETLLSTPLPAQVIPPAKAKSLLGQEFRHAIFDARNGFNLDALAILSGTLIAGSFLLLILPSDMTAPDADSVRWNDAGQAIATPNFVAHLTSLLSRREYIYFCSENKWLDYLIQQSAEGKSSQSAIHANDLSVKTVLSATDEQQQRLDKLLNTRHSVVVLTAKRGRGKSALAGLFTHHRQCWITAANPSAVKTLQRFATPETRFFAPDNLLQHLASSAERPEWLIIDEAAMLPIPVLEQLIQQVKPVLLTTTTDGYEGTGQGFMLKLLPLLGEHLAMTLTAPIRWPENDPLEPFISELLLTAETPNSAVIEAAPAALIYRPVTANELIAQNKLAQIYPLLKQAHYRTSPVDLRRLLDAPNMHIAEAVQGQKTIAAILTIKEGGLSAELSQDIWRGCRRPRGNLVAQSLTAHAGESASAELLSLRVNRLVVDSAYRRQGIAQQLVKQQITLAKNLQYDFVSVSYAYNDEMYQFWSHCGFSLVHIGSHKEASSGSYAAMAIYPLSDAGKALQQRLVDKLTRNWPWLANIIQLKLPIESDQTLQMYADDWHELSGFANYYRPLEASYAALCRLLFSGRKSLNQYITTACPLLNLLIKQQWPEQAIIELYAISGKNELLKRLRQETKQLLAELDK